MARTIDDCYSIEDLHQLAATKIPGPFFDYARGGADDEWTMRRNSTAFQEYDLLQRVLRDVSSIDMTTRVLGAELSMPLALSPTGGTRMFHPEGERAVARAAARAGTGYALSSVSNTSIEDIAAASDCPKWFQIYVWRDRGLNSAFIERARAAGFKGLMLTVDLPVAGNRERDLRNGLSMPPKPTPKLLAALAAHPTWTRRFFAAKRPVLANIVGQVSIGTGMGVMEYINSQFDQTVDWDDAARMIQEWGGPFAIKGIMAPDDAELAVQAGASAIMVSNHGGRQLDGAPAPVDMIEEIADRVAGRAEVILDGGVRRGTDVLKALALGATACTTGRPYLYGLCAGGEPGVDRALGLLKAEIKRGMALLGVTKVSEITRAHVRRRP